MKRPRILGREAMRDALPQGLSIFAHVAHLSPEDEAAVDRDLIFTGNAIIHLRNGMAPRRVDPLEVFTDLKDSIHPSALPKEGNTMIDHPAVEAVRRELQNIMQRGFSDRPARAMLRVEYSREHEPEIWKRARDADAHDLARQLGSSHDGPITIEGVAWYCVPTLPEPGWRVINPMKADRHYG